MMRVAALCTFTLLCSLSVCVAADLPPCPADQCPDIQPGKPGDGMRTGTKPPAATRSSSSIKKIEKNKMKGSAQSSVPAIR